jgi:hypothetical protein
MLRTQIKHGGPKLEELERVSRDARLYVRREPADRLLLTSRATSRGMRSATYVALLVRSHWEGSPTRHCRGSLPSGAPRAGRPMVTKG